MSAVLTSEQLTERVATWWPAALTPAPGPPAALAFARRVVLAAGPRVWTEARTCCNYVYDYAVHLEAQGELLDETVVFSRDRIEAYRAQALGGKSNTSNAVCSYLRRMAPGVGFAGTLRKAGARTKKAGAAAAPTAGETESAPDDKMADPAGDATPAAAPVVLSAEVEAVFVNYVPEALDADLWKQVSPLVHGVVRAAAPDLPAAARDMVRAGAYLAGWVVRADRPLRRDVVLAGPTIEEFLTTFAKARVPSNSVGSYASWLHGLRDANGIELVGGRRRWGRKEANEPYTDAELRRLLDRVDHIDTPRRRRYAHAAVRFVVHTGALGVEAGWATPDSIVEVAPGVVEVRLARPAADIYDDPDAAGALLGLGSKPLDRMRRRSVTAHGAAATELLELKAAAVAADDTWLLGGSANPSTRRCRTNMVLKPAKGVDVDFDLGRGRATWLVEAAASARYTTVVELCAAAGLEGLDAVDHLLVHIRARRAALLAHSSATPQAATA